MGYKIIPDEHLHEVKGAKVAKAGQVLVSIGDGTIKFEEEIDKLKAEIEELKGL